MPQKMTMQRMERAAAKAAGCDSVSAFRRLWPNLQEEYKNRVLAANAIMDEDGN